MFLFFFSGEKRKGFARGTEVPSLFSQCIQVLKSNVDYIEEVGGLGYDILKPVLIMANAETLIRIEDINPHLMEDTAEVGLRVTFTLDQPSVIFSCGRSLLRKSFIRRTDRKWKAGGKCTRDV